MKHVVEKVSRIEGVLKVPGDKSISHRALILGGLARGRQVIDGLADAADVRSTMNALRAAGCFVECMPDGRTIVMNTSPRDEYEIDAGNSGTTARLMTGYAAARSRTCRIDGDASLRKRPMARVAAPLARMGARVMLSEGGTLPLTVEGAPLRGILHDAAVASAQVKSAILIAALHAVGDTTVVEPVPTRDHTELLMTGMGAGLVREGNTVTVRGGSTLDGIHVSVPGDVSSAAFFVAAALVVPGSRVHLPFTGLNPRRTGIFDVWRAMGARIEAENLDGGTEPAGDVTAWSGDLTAATIDDPAVVASIIDEIPILAVVATRAQGRTTIRGARELRHKESDRIAAMVHNLRALGANVEEFEDGFAVDGPADLRGAPVSSFGDHRIAMAMAVAGLVAEGRTEIDDASAVEISYPRFFADLRTLGR